MIGAMTKDDVQDTGNKGRKYHVPYAAPLLGTRISDDCRHSSKTFAQAYQYAVDTMGAPVALGSDFNGIAGHVGPRFGSDACGGDIPLSVEVGPPDERSAQIRSNSKLEYPFTLPGFGTFDLQVTGQKTFDFNVDGLAHVGLLPDLIKDMKAIGLSETYIDALFNSAEEYVRVWERATAISEFTSVPTPPNDLSCPALALCTGADDVPPEVLCSEDLVKECTGPNTNVMFDPATASADSCGAAISQGCTVASGSAFNLGLTEVTCSAIDTSQNVGFCDVSVVVTDTIMPEITAPPDLANVECTSPQGASPDLGLAVASDVCDTTAVVGNDALSVFPVRMTSAVTWTATDGSGNTNTANQLVEVVDTTPPAITCPADIVAECTGNNAATITPGIANGFDVCSTSVALTSQPIQSFGLGITTLGYTATDDEGLIQSCTSNVTIQDTEPPTINSIAATPSSLWPPNHKMKRVALQVVATDACSPVAPVCTIANISSNEPENGLGDGDQSPDWEITGPLTADLRRERSGTGSGRIYTLEITCADQQGLSTTSMTSVTVANNQSD